MNLYRLEDGTFVGTQADAKSSGQKWEPFDFPINPKADTIQALNRLVAEKASQTPQPAEPTPTTETVTDEASHAERLVTQNLDGKEKVEGVVEFIMKAHVLTLGRVAGAVSLRYNELAKRKRK